jgi:hypothetical protein
MWYNKISENLSLDSLPWTASPHLWKFESILVVSLLNHLFAQSAFV